MIELPYGNDIIYVLAEEHEKPIKIVMENICSNAPKVTLKELVYSVKALNVGLFTLE